MDGERLSGGLAELLGFRQHTTEHAADPAALPHQIVVAFAGSSLFPVETPVPLGGTTEHEKGISLIINNLLLFSE
jgi:hypothetical protein